MEAKVLGKPSFGRIEVTLEPTESIIAESDAMANMAGDLDMTARFNGGFFSGLSKKFLGKESLFVNEFTNNKSRPRQLVLTSNLPGDIREHRLEGGGICMQPGAYIASTPDVKLGVQWAGFSSWIGREGLLRLEAKGNGSVWYGAYGGMLEKEIDGEYIVDTGHLVAYDPQIKLKAQLAGGLISSLFGGEGLVTRLEGHGTAIIQTRTLSGLASWLNPKLR
ncbi:MAG: TIGR00266 family protein [Planctomycetota bacterium]